jgi:NADH-quinone oxidoreductase subunit A
LAKDLRVVTIDYILVFLTVGVLFVVGNYFLSSLLRPFHPNAKKLATYECGEEPFGTAWVQYNVRYYLFAVFFVIFDVEALFLIPWALVFKSLGAAAFLEMLIFLFLLFMALIHVWKKGGLKWV